MNNQSSNAEVDALSDKPIHRGEDASAARAGSAIDLGKLLLVLWKGKWFISAITILSAVISIAVVLYLPNQYKATVTLMPSSMSSTSSLSRLAGQFGGLAALVGGGLGAQADGDKTVAAMELVKSWGFQEQFIRDNQLEVPVFAANGWNRATNKLTVDPQIYDIEHKKWVRKFKPAAGQSAQPSGWELFERFSPLVAISQDKKTSLISLSVEYYSPNLAKEWVDKLVLSVNKQLQERDRLEAERSIEYLQEKMSQTSLTEMKTVFAHLIEEQTKNLMLTQVDDEYVLKTLAPAKIPEKSSSPKRALICIVATLSGFLLSVLIWLAFELIRERSGGRLA